MKGKGFWIFDFGYGDGSDWVCSKCGNIVRMKDTWNCPTNQTCDKCGVEMSIPDDVEHEYLLFVD